MNWKPLNLNLVKWQFFFKALSFENGLSYWALLGLEWKIFCHSLLICYHLYVGYWSLAVMNMSRCPYIYELDSIWYQPQSSSNFFDTCTVMKTSLLKKRKKKRFSPKNWAYFVRFADPKLFSITIWVLAWQNGQLLPIFSENLKVFGLVVLEL